MKIRAEEWLASEATIERRIKDQVMAQLNADDLPDEAFQEIKDTPEAKDIRNLAHKIEKWGRECGEDFNSIAFGNVESGFLRGSECVGWDQRGDVDWDGENWTLRIGIALTTRQARILGRAAGTYHEFDQPTHRKHTKHAPDMVALRLWNEHKARLGYPPDVS